MNFWDSDTWSIRDTLFWAFIFAAIIGLSVAQAWVNDGYRHPCAEDEYVRVDGACVHADVIRAEVTP